MNVLNALVDLAFDIYLFPTDYSLENSISGDWVTPVNLLLGWTIVGWIITAVWVLVAPKYRPHWSDLSIPYIGGEKSPSNMERALYQLENARKYGTLVEYLQQEAECRAIAKGMLEHREAP